MSIKIDRRKTTEGKKLGKIAFYLSELIVVILVVAVAIGFVKAEAEIITAVLLFQGTIFSVTWGAKASANFAKGKKYETEP